MLQTIKNQHFIAFTWSLLACFISVLNDAIMKLYSVNLSPAVIIFLRFSISLLTIFPFYLAHHFRNKHNKHKNKLQTHNKTRSKQKIQNITQTHKLSNQLIHILRGIMITVAMLLWVYNANKLPLHIVTISSFTIPFFNIICSRIFLKEKTHFASFLYILISFCCVLAIFWSFQFSTTNLLALIFTGILFSMLDILNKNLLNKNESTLKLIFFSNFYSTLTLLIAYIIFTKFSQLSQIFEFTQDSPQSIAQQSMAQSTMQQSTSFTSHIKTYTNEFINFIELSKISLQIYRLTFTDWIIFFVLGSCSNGIIFCILRSFTLSNLSAIQYTRYTEFLISFAFGFIFFHENITLQAFFASIVIMFCNIMSFQLHSKSQKKSQNQKIQH